MSSHQEEWDTKDSNVSTSYQVAHIVTLLIFTLFATVAVALRFWARQIQKQALALNDYLIVLGLVFGFGEIGIGVYVCCFPPQWKGSTQFPDRTLAFQLIFISPIIWVIGVTIIRASILFLYIHIFPTRSFRTACYGTLLFNMMFLTATILADCLTCRPIKYIWDSSIKGGSCGDGEKLGLFIAIVNFLQDFIVVVLPMPILWNLQMAVNRKAALTGMFGMGILICAVTIYRIQLTATMINPSDPSLQEDLALIALLTSLETLLGIISACLPILKPIIKKLWSSLPKRGSDTNKPSTSGSIPIIMRISHMFTASSNKHSSGEHISSLDQSWSEMQVGKHGKVHVSPTRKADWTTEHKLVELPARIDKDVESVYNAR